MKLYADLEDVMAEEQQKRKIWKLVLTGGPCGGKTTGQARYFWVGFIHLIT
jgi:predicted ATPase